MTECLPDLPRYIRQHGDEWQGADHPDGPWRPIPAPQSGLPWKTDGPAVPESREPASVTPEATGQPRQLSPVAQAVFDAWIYPHRFPVDKAGKGAKTALAQALRAVADQAVPEAANAVGDAHDEARLDQWLRIRWKILAIAAELEGSNG
jgi:hypothetical protein